MTEQEWKSETDPLADLLPVFPERNAPAARKLRLYLSACSDRLRDRLPSGYNTTIRVAAQFADNCASAEDSDFAVYVAEGLHYSHPDYVASSRYYEEQYRKRTVPLE